MGKRGIMADSPTTARWTAFAWLALFTVALVSLGFGVWSPGQDVVYRLDILMVCAPISAASLLLGTYAGLACGLTAGIVLSVYGIFQPTNTIDIYGSPLLVYIVTFTLFGLVSGVVVNRILRSRSHGRNHIARLALATLMCLVLILPVYACVSVYSIFSDVMNLAESLDVPEIIHYVVLLSLQSPALVAAWVLLNGVVIFAALLAAEAIARVVLLPSSPPPIQTSIRMRLILVMTLVFFVASGIAHTSITSICESDAAEGAKTVLNLFATYMQSIWDEEKSSLEAQGVQPTDKNISAAVSVSQTK